MLIYLRSQPLSHVTCVQSKLWILQFKQAYRQLCYCRVTVHDKRKCNTNWANILDSFVWILTFIMFIVNFLIYSVFHTSIFINAIQEGLTLKRLPLTLFCLSLHYPTCVATLPYTALEIGQVVRHCDWLRCELPTIQYTAKVAVALWLTEMWEKVSSFHFPFPPFPHTAPPFGR